MSRSRRIALIAVAVAGFLVVSLVLTRVLAASTAERTAVVDAIRAQSIARPGTFKLLRYDGPTRFGFTARTGIARVAWKVGSTLPLVQCATVRRSGNLVTGFDVKVTAIGAPVGLESDC